MNKMQENNAKDVIPKGFVADAELEMEKKDRSHIRLRKTLTVIALIVLVSIMNGLVIAFLFYIHDDEMYLLKHQIIGPKDRVIDAKVLLSLIGGTVAQVSALLVLALKSIFKN